MHVVKSTNCLKSSEETLSLKCIETGEITWHYATKWMFNQPFRALLRYN